MCTMRRLVMATHRRRMSTVSTPPPHRVTAASTTPVVRQHAWLTDLRAVFVEGDIADPSLHQPRSFTDIEMSGGRRELGPVAPRRPHPRRPQFPHYRRVDRAGQVDQACRDNQGRDEDRGDSPCPPPPKFLPGVVWCRDVHQDAHTFYFIAARLMMDPLSFMTA